MPVTPARRMRDAASIDALKDEGRRANEGKYTEFALMCDDGAAHACNSLGEWYALMRQDHRTAGDLFAMACFAGAHPQACLNTGMMLLQGIGVPAAPSRAASAFSLGCEGGNADSCFQSGRGLLKGVLARSGGTTNTPTSGPWNAEDTQSGRGLLKGVLARSGGTTSTPTSGPAEDARAGGIPHVLRGAGSGAHDGAGGGGTGAGGSATSSSRAGDARADGVAPALAEFRSGERAAHRRAVPAVAVPASYEPMAPRPLWATQISISAAAGALDRVPEASILPPADSVALAHRHLSLGCESGTTSPAAKCCGVLAGMLLDRARFGVSPATPRAPLGMLEKACAGEHSQSCFRLAAIHRKGNAEMGVTPNPHAAAAFERQGLMWSGLSERKAEQLISKHS